MAEQLKINFTPAPTSKKFMASDAKMRVLVGPVGSGKSVTCSFEIVRRAAQQAHNKQGIRKSRWAIIRQTVRQLSDTTIKTFLDWFPPGRCGEFMRTTKTYHLKIADIEAEIMFRALDDADDVANLNSLELTGAWFNECRDIAPEIIDAMSKRIGRYPSGKDGGPTWYGMWGDTNPPIMDTWWYYMMEHIKPEDGVSPNPNGWEVFKQPSGRSQDAENIENLPEGYYDTTGRSDDYIRVFIDGEYGHSLAGTPVFKFFKPDYHISKNPLRPIINGVRPLVVGIDLGLCYSDDTEVLTRDGWKLFRDVDEAVDEVATLNPNGYKLEYTPINFKVAKPYKGDMIAFKGQNFDFLVTPEHRTPFSHRETPNKLHFASAEELAGKTTAHRYIQLQANWDSCIYSLCGLPEDMSMEFWGWYLSEGSTYKKRNSYRIDITQKKPAPTLDALMTRPEWADIGIVWHKGKGCWRASNRRLGEQTYTTGKARTKYIPTEVKNASKAGIETFLAAFIAGDGHVRNRAKKNSGVGRKCRNERTAFTTSPWLRDDLQEMALKAGLCAAARFDPGKPAMMLDGRIIPASPGWTLAFKDISRAEIQKQHISKVPYDGMIYCLNVPYHTLYVRRNGRPCWNGNTPAAVIGQQDPRGRMLVLAEAAAFDMGIQRFSRTVLKPLLNERFLGLPVHVVVDPAGIQRAQTDERSAVDILRQEGFMVKPARTNTISARINAVDDFLMRQVDGDSAFLMDPSCSHLKAALMGGYRYRDKAEVIDKNKHSHIAEALQYFALHVGGLGEAHYRSAARQVKPVSAVGWT